MEQLISALIKRYENGHLDRRQLIRTLGGLAVGRAPQAIDAVSIASINHVSMQVRDVERSVAFYTRTFGLVNEGSDATTARLASGRCHVSLRRGEPVGIIDHFAFGVNRFDEGPLRSELKRRGAETRNEGQFGFHVVDPDGVRVQIIENDAKHR